MNHIILVLVLYILCSKPNSLANASKGPDHKVLEFRIVAM